MKIKLLIVFTVMLQMSLVGCRQEKNKIMNIESIRLFQENIEYPYIASEKRKSVVFQNMNKLEKGMTKERVFELLSQPDECHLTHKFKKAKSDNVIGFSLVYILRQNVESGSVLEKNEQLIRIHFDDSETLISAYSIDINQFKVIEK